MVYHIEGEISIYAVGENTLCKNKKENEVLSHMSMHFGKEQFCQHHLHFHTHSQHAWCVQ